MNSSIKTLDRIQVIDGLKGLSSFLGTIQQTVANSQMFGNQLPLIGDKLKGGDSSVQFISTLKTGFDTAQTQLAQFNVIKPEEIQQELFNALKQANGGVDLIKDFNGDNQITKEDIKIDTPVNTPDEIKFNLKLGNNNTLSTPLASGLGLPGLGLNVNGNANVALNNDFDLSFGINKDGFFVDTGADNELNIGLNTSLAGLDVDGTLGFSKLNVKDYTAAPSSINAQLAINLDDVGGGDNKLTLKELQSLSLPDFHKVIKTQLNGNANVNFKVKSYWDSSVVLPSIDFDLNFGLPNIFDPASIQSANVNFNNLTVDLQSVFGEGKFATEILGNVNSKLEPFRPVVNALKRNINFITDPFPGLGLDPQTFLSVVNDFASNKGVNISQFPFFESDKITVMDLLYVAGEMYEKLSGEEIGVESLKKSVPFIKLIDNFDGLINATKSINGSDIKLGNVSFNLSNPDKPIPSGNIDPIPNNVTAKLQAFGSNLKFPILNQPQVAFDLLMGKKPVDLFTYNLPTFDFGIEFPNAVSIPIYGPLTFNVGAGVNLDIFTGELDFGFDTKGLLSGAANTDILKKGFYLSDNYANGKDNPEATLTGELRAGIGLGTPGIATTSLADIGGIVKASVDFNLQNGSDPSKVRLDELTFPYFDIEPGKVSAQLDGSVKINLATVLKILESVKSSGDATGKFVERYLENAVKSAGFDPKLVNGTLQVVKYVTNPVKVVEEYVEKVASWFGLEKVFEEVVKTRERVVGWVTETVNATAQELNDISINLDFKSDKIILWEPKNSTGGTPSASLEPKLASLEGNTLWLNMGPRWEYRKKPNFNVGDVSETFVVRQNLSGSTTVSAFGFTQGYPSSYSNIKADGGNQNDRIILDVNVPTILEGGSGNDEILSGTGNDTISGGDGNDTLIGNNGTDILTGGKDDDQLEGGLGNDSLYGEGGKDLLYGGEDNDYLDGGDGSDYLYGEGGQDTLKGGINDDQTSGGDGNDYLYGESGQDTIFGDLGSDYIEGGSEDDQIYGGKDNDYLDGGDGSDYLYGEGGQDTLKGGINDDQISGGDGNDYLYGESGQDAIFGDLGSDYIEGGSEDDQIYGGKDNDYIDGGDGSDYLYGEGGQDTLKGGINDDQISGGDGNDYLYGESGQDAIFGDLGSDYIEGGSEDDQIYGGDDADQIYGNSDNDFLMGEAGNDLIDGGTEIDTVTYQTSPKGVTANIDETQNYSNNSTDRVDIEPKFTINSGTAKDGYGNTDTLKNLENIIGSEFDDILIGNSSNNRIEALAGKDLLIGNAGNDTLDGGNDIDTASYRRDPMRVAVNLEQNTAADGFGNTDKLFNIENVVGSTFNDDITGDAKANTITAGDGNDLIFGRNGNDSIYGETGEDTIFAEADDDLIVGGKDADALDGGTGDDTASYFNSETGVAVSLLTGKGWLGDAKGDTLTQIENLIGSEFIDTLIGDNGNNRIDGLAGTDIIDGGLGNDTIDGGFDRDRILGSAGDDLLYGKAGIDYIAGGEGNDYLDGGTENDQLYSQQGNDTLDGGEGNDYAEGGDGDDSLAGSGGNDQLYGQAGKDTLSGNAGNDYLEGGDSEDLLSGNEGNDYLYGQNGKDTIDGGIGNDNLDGGADSDLMSGGEDNDRLYGQAGSDTLEGNSGNDLLSGGDDADIIKGQAGVDFLEGGNGNDSLDGGDNDDLLYGNADNDILSGGNGNDLLDGGDNDDLLYGNAGSDRIYGQAGSDTLFGGTDNDFLDGGNDGDTLSGETGNDTLFGKDGDDSLMGGEGNDSLDGGNGDDLLSGQEGNDEIFGSAGRDSLEGDAGDDSLDGGTGEDDLYGRTGNDSLLGGAGNDYLDAGEGDDTLQGQAGNDYLDGGEGDDSLAGGSNNDQLYGQAGDDTLSGDANNDYLEGGDGDDSLAGGDNNDQLYGQAGKDTLDGGKNDDYLEGGDDDDSLTGGAGHDQLYGQAGKDALDAGAGDDYLEGGDGDDSLVGGDDQDQLLGNAGNDFLDGGKGIDLLDGGDGDDTLTGNQGDDSLTGNAGNDLLLGGAGNDAIDGGEGDNTLYGGAGKDTLTGGSGKDTFVLVAGSGPDTISNFIVGSDRLGLTNNLTFEQLKIAQGAGNNTSNTLIHLQGQDELLASLVGVQATNLTLADFTFL